MQQLWVTVILTALAAAGALVGVVAAVRGVGAPPPSPDAGRGLLRLTGVVHTGWEQTLIGLTRELGLPRGPESLRYGQLYVEVQSEHQLYIRSRSEIGRGFIGAVELVPAARSTAVSYAILRLPGDDDIHHRVLDLELQMIAALRRVDGRVEVQLEAGALREIDQPRRTAGGA